MRPEKRKSANGTVSGAHRGPGIACESNSQWKDFLIQGISNSILRKVLLQKGVLN